MKICYIPGRESTYSRTRVILKSMKEAGIEVYDCSFHKKSFVRYFISFFKFLRYKNKADIIFIGFFGHLFVPIIKIFTKKKILFDAFVSIYQTCVFDRKSFKQNNILAYIARYFDRLSCRLSDKILLDTNQHINYFVNEFKLNKSKFSRLLLGSDESVMFPRETKNSEFIVHFHGEFQSLHGTPYIVEAARILKDIKFQMVGKGRELDICLKIVQEENITNINFIQPVSYEKLAEHISQASVCLGIFGDTQKAQLVIPHKVYEALAMKKALITANTPAARELLTHEENALLCDIANPNMLAAMIMKLKNDPILLNKIASNGHQLFKERCSLRMLGNKILQMADNLNKL